MAGKLDWKPEEIFRFHGGKYPGRSICELMFVDYEHILDIFKNMISKMCKISETKRKKMKLSDFLRFSMGVQQKDRSLLHKNLDYYLRQGEIISHRKNTIICPHCGEEMVAHFSTINKCQYGIVIDPELIFCKNKKCKDFVRRKSSLVHQRFPKVKSFRFSVFVEANSFYLSEVGEQNYKNDIKNLFMKVFNIPKIEDKLVFDFFQ